MIDDGVRRRRWRRRRRSAVEEEEMGQAGAHGAAGEKMTKDDRRR